MTVKLGTFTFVNEPRISFGVDVDLAGKKKFGGGTTFDYTGHSPLTIVLSGKLTGSNCYTDRDTLIALAKGGSKVDFYADTIGYGSETSPKQVWIESLSFTHVAGKPNQVAYRIVLREET